MTLFNFSIDDHEFEVVEIEGMIVKRNEKKTDRFKSFNINVGQRVSILVTAKNDTKVNPPTYWMRFHSKGCYASDSALDLWAVVCYNETDSKCPPPPEKVVDNSNITCEDTIRELKPYCDRTDYPLFCDPPPPNASVCE